MVKEPGSDLLFPNPKLKKYYYLVRDHRIATSQWKRKELEMDSHKRKVFFTLKRGLLA